MIFFQKGTLNGLKNNKNVKKGAALGGIPVGNDDILTVRGGGQGYIVGSGWRCRWGGVGGQRTVG